MTLDDPMHDRAAAFRDAFDQSFAHAVGTGPAAVVDLLAITVGGEPYALRLSEVSGLFVDKAVMWLPSPAPALLGVAGFRGTVLPVYDLGRLLGRDKAAAARWLVVAGGASVALAFERFDGFLRVPPERLMPDARDQARGHIREILDGESPRPIVHVASLLERLVKQAAVGRPR